MTTIQVVAIPVDETQMTLECSVCGPVGLIPRDEAASASKEHMRTHGARFVSEEWV